MKAQSTFFFLKASYLICLVFYLDGNALNITMPTISSAFEIDPPDGRGAILSFYLAFMFSYLLKTPIFYSPHAKKRLLIVQILYIVSTLLCGVTNSIGALLSFRFIQGFFGGLSVFGLNHNNGESKTEKNTLVLFLSPLIIASFLGPILSSHITDTFGFRFLFFFKLPLSLYILYLTKTQDETQNKTSEPPIYDYRGFLFFSFAITCILCFFGSYSIDALRIELSILFFLLFLFFLTLFIKQESKSKNPIIELSLLTFKNIQTKQIIKLIFSMILFGFPFFFALYLKINLHYSLLEAGYFLSLMGLGLALSEIVSPLFKNKGSKTVVYLSCFILFASFIALGFFEIPRKEALILFLFFASFASSVAIKGIENVEYTSLSCKKESLLQFNFLSKQLGNLLGTSLSIFFLCIILHQAGFSHLSDTEDPAFKQSFQYLLQGFSVFPLGAFFLCYRAFK